MYLNTKTDRILGIILHLSGFLNGMLPLAIPFGIWLVKKDESPFLRAHGKAAINFQLSAILLAAIATVFIFFTIGLGALIVIPLAAIYGLLYIFFVLSGAIKASNGQLYTYPFTWKIIN